MKIYNEVVIDMNTGETIYEDSYEYEGDVFYRCLDDVGDAWDNTLGKDGIGGFVGDVYDETLGVKGLAGGVQEVGETMYDMYKGRADWGDFWDEAFGKDGLAGGLGDVYDETLGKDGVGGAIGDGWDWFFPAGTSVWFGRGDDEATKLKKQAKHYMSKGFEGLQGQYDAYLGGDGFLQREYDIQTDKLNIAENKLDIKGDSIANQQKSVGLQTSSNMRNVMDTYRRAAGGTGMAYSGTAESMKRDSRNDLVSGYNLQMDNIGLSRQTLLEDRKSLDLDRDTAALNFEKGKADFVSGLREKMTTMLTGYHQASGETYSSDALDELNQLFDEYESGG
jgi:hypothetical protein